MLTSKTIIDWGFDLLVDFFLNLFLSFSLTRVWFDFNRHIINMKCHVGWHAIKIISSAIKMKSCSVVLRIFSSDVFIILAVESAKPEWNHEGPWKINLRSSAATWRCKSLFVLHQKKKLSPTFSQPLHAFKRPRNKKNLANRAAKVKLKLGVKDHEWN